MKTKYFNLIKDIQEKDLIFSLYFTQMLLLTIAFILGLFLFDSISSFLALFTIDDPNILIDRRDCWSNRGFSRSDSL